VVCSLSLMPLSYILGVLSLSLLFLLFGLIHASVPLSFHYIIIKANKRQREIERTWHAIPRVLWLLCFSFPRQCNDNEACSGKKEKERRNKAPFGNGWCQRKVRFRSWGVHFKLNKTRAHFSRLFFFNLNEQRGMKWNVPCHVLVRVWKGSQRRVYFN